jgi:hypothetical protein
MKLFEEFIQDRELVEETYFLLEEKVSREELEELLNEGIFGWIKGLFLNPRKKRALRKYSERLFKIRVEISKLNIEDNAIEEFERELEDEEDSYSYNNSNRRNSSRDNRGKDIDNLKKEQLKNEEQEIITAMDDIGAENETLRKYVSKVKLESRAKSTEAIMKIADSEIKRVLQKMKKKDFKEIKKLDAEIKKEI